MNQVRIAVWQRRRQYICHHMGFGHIKSTYNPVNVLITGGRLWTPTVSCNWAEITLLMRPNREILLVHISNCIQSWNPRIAAGNWAAISVSFWGRKSLVPRRFWNFIARRTLRGQSNCSASTMQHENNKFIESSIMYPKKQNSVHRKVVTHSLCASFYNCICCFI